MIKTQIKKGINLYTVRDTKFKAFRVCLIFHRPLTREEVSLNTLLAAVMKMQSKNYPNAGKIAEELEELYGAELIVRASKYGERQLIKIGIRGICDEALGEKGNFERAMKLLYDIAFCAGDNGAFSESIVKTEKKNIKDAILAQKNDKGTYSVLRLQEEMCKTEPYGINPMGYIDDLERTDKKALWEHYQRVIKESAVDIIFTGNFKEDAALKTAESFFKDLSERSGINIKEQFPPFSGEIKRVTEKTDVTQGKLCMGFRAAKGMSDKNYPAALVYNSVFGGSAVSKLFNNVREKLSLCYYVGSSLDRLKEIMIVRSGVEFENFGKAYDEIMAQQSLMEKGEFSDEEIDFAKKQLIGAYEANLDSISATAEYYTMQILLGTDVSVGEMIDKIKNVTREEIIREARGMKLDTVYFIDKE